MQYPYTVNVSNNGYGALEATTPGARQGKPVTLRKAYGSSVESITVQDPWGRNLPVSGNANSGYTFTMPRCDVTVSVRFSGNSLLSAHKGSASDPYTIGSSDDWNAFAYYVNHGNNFSGKYVKLTKDITISKTVGLGKESIFAERPFSGIFLGNGHTLTANISNTNSAEGGQAPFHFIKDATIKNLTVTGTIASNSRHTAGLVGFAEGTNLIEGCTVSATLNVSSDYAGGFIGHGLTSSTTIRDCVFTGTITGIDGSRPNMAGIWGWSDSGKPVLVNCLERGTYNNVSSMHPMGLMHNAGSITDCYYVNPMIGTPDHACTVSGAYLVKASVPANDIYKPVTAADANTYYMPCTVSGVCKKYQYTGSDIAITPPIVTAGDGTVLKEGTDYTYTVSPAIVKEQGDYTMAISGQGSYAGTSYIVIAVSDEISVTEESTVLTGNCMVYNDVTIAERITVRGNVVLNLCEGATLTATKGIELSKGNTLTINGPGALTIDSPDAGKSGIGAVEVGTLIINGGKINVKGGEQAAGFGGDKNNTSGGSITINGGVVEVAGDVLGGASGIGGGNDDQVGHYGVCGDIVINGGQVRAMGLVTSIGQGYQKPGVDETTYTSGTLTLGWTNLDDYFHDCSIQGVFSRKMGVNSVTFVEGKQFIYDIDKTIAKPDSIGGRKIRPNFTLPGEGTEDKPYTIDSVEVWNDFVNYVNYGYSFSGKHVKLTTDISVEKMCGTVSGDVPGNAFSGIFDGDSHTITATLTDTDNQGTALFRYINGATIKNVLVAGTINGGMHAAAIVGFANGTGNILTNCAATASVSGGSHIGGLLGNALDGDMAITGCVYAGMMTGGDTANDLRRRRPSRHQGD
ncbi:MAG: hypothetical protein IKH35_00925 [Prevotella sp.]|nr:hypothetical protein [Prevotella sp.]